MTQEDKDLLLKDLSARLPYHPVIRGQKNYSINEGLLGSISTSGVWINPGYISDISSRSYLLDEIKPYLRPMSSMTEEEFDEYSLYLLPTSIKLSDGLKTGLLVDDLQDLFDWLNKHHFDYRGLIEKGLALEAPKNMYKF